MTNATKRAMQTTLAHADEAVAAAERALKEAQHDRNRAALNLRAALLDAGLAKVGS